MGLDTEFTGAGVQEAGATGSLDEPEPSVGINKVFINVVIYRILLKTDFR